MHDGSLQLPVYFLLSDISDMSTSW